MKEGRKKDNESEGSNKKMSEGSEGKKRGEMRELDKMMKMQD